MVERGRKIPISLCWHSLEINFWKCSRTYNAALIHLQNFDRLLLLRQILLKQLQDSWLLENKTKGWWKLTFSSGVSVCSLKYEESGKFGKNYRCVRVAQGKPRTTQASWVLSWCMMVECLSLDSSGIHGWRMDQLLHYFLMQKFKCFITLHGG